MTDGWRKLKPSLGQAISHIHQTGLYTDMTFKVGPTGHEVSAHKVIVMARSEVFATMLQDRWDGCGADSGRNVIDIPGASPNAFNYLITYFYADELDTEISIPDRLEVFRLAHMYQVPGLISKSFAFLKSQISVDNCVQIYQGTRLCVEDEVDLSQMAYDFIKKNIKAVLASEEFLQFDQQGLMQLLQTENLMVDEVELFKAILRWANHEMSPNAASVSVNLTPRKETLQSLIPLIRFPLMGALAFDKEVVRTNVLSRDEVAAIIRHFNGTATECLGFSAKPRHYPASTLKRLKCYADQVAFRIQQLEPLIPQTEAVLQFRFCCTKGITIHGLCFYGPDVPSRLLKSEYEIEYTISSVQDPSETLAQKELKVEVIESGDFNVLLDKPLDIQPNVDYSVNLKGNVKDLWMPRKNLFRIGKQAYNGNDGQPQVVSVNEDKISCAINYPEPPTGQSSPDCTYGMIHSILYTL